MYEVRAFCFILSVVRYRPLYGPHHTLMGGIDRWSVDYCWLTAMAAYYADAFGREICFSFYLVGFITTAPIRFLPDDPALSGGGVYIPSLQREGP